VRKMENKQKRIQMQQDRFIDDGGILEKLKTFGSYQDGQMSMAI
jgi:hypothetical protein